MFALLRCLYGSEFSILTDLKPGKLLGIIIIFLARISNEICKLLNEQISGFILKRHCYKWINNYKFSLVPIIHEIWNVGKEIVGTVS